MRVLFCCLPLPRVLRNRFSLFFSVCVCLCGPQVLPCIVHLLHQPLLSSPPPRPPSPPANESQRRLLGNGVAQPTPDSDSEEEFVPNSFLVKSGSASLGVAANGKCFSLLLTFNGLFLFMGYVYLLRPLAPCKSRVTWCMEGLVSRQGPGRFCGLGVASYGLCSKEKALSRDRCARQRYTDSKRLDSRQKQRHKLEGGGHASPIGLLLGASDRQAQSPVASSDPTHNAPKRGVLQCPSLAIRKLRDRMLPRARGCF